MRLLHHSIRRALAAFLVCATPLAAQRTATPALQGARVAGELAAGAVGFTLGSHAGLFAGAGIAYVVRGRGGDISDSPGLMRMAWTTIVIGGGAGAGTAAWLASRTNDQTSSLGWDIGAATAATVLTFAWADWPMRPDKPRRPMSRVRLLAPVWGSALAATIAATATRERR